MNMLQINRNKYKKVRKNKRLGNLHYTSKNYSNPFFEKKQKRTPSKSFGPSLGLKVKLFLLLSFVLFVSVLIFCFYSNYFTITEVTAKGEGRVDPKLIEKHAWDQIDGNLFVLLPQKNLFLFGKNSLSKMLNKKYSLSSLIIEKKLPNKLEITYKEKKDSMIWLEKDIYYYCDEYGYIISKASIEEVEQKDYPIIENLSNKEIHNNKVYISQIDIDYNLNLFAEFKQYENDFKIEKFVVDNEINTVKVKLKDGPSVYIDTTISAEKQLNKLITIKNEILKDDFKNKTYIDVRIGESVYYR